jgi:hypothetical protein
MTRRAAFMKDILFAGRLLALHPLFIAQAKDVAALLDETPGRHKQAYPRSSELEETRMRDEAYHDLLSPLFKDVANARVVPGRFGHPALVAAAEAGSSRARNLLLLGTAPPATLAGAFTPAPPPRLPRGCRRRRRTRLRRPLPPLRPRRSRWQCRGRPR